MHTQHVCIVRPAGSRHTFIKPAAAIILGLDTWYLVYHARGTENGVYCTALVGREYSYCPTKSSNSKLSFTLVTLQQRPFTGFYHSPPQACLPGGMKGVASVRYTRRLHASLGLSAAAGALTAVTCWFKMCPRFPVAPYETNMYGTPLS